MEFYLHRIHYKGGTNGALFHKQQFLCFCIELPWRLNARNVSCIPDGTYEMRPFFSLRFKHHLRLIDVPGRSGILLHPANNAQTELRGCIAPVSQLTGIGRGLGSRRALDKVLMRIEGHRETHEAITLTVISELSGR
ncbi:MULTISPECIES: DUF5675 family protein [Aequorivita]|uniref:DUF5675 family protein n=2 Tax=Aequorivita TaxID=153265 RepID=A0AB35YV04_9FLAO|nr:DUF5675 family protein [Aequorivita sp. Ant34-E75]WGF92192.1 DUF5675 family protein [Aequorivita sp. Ant34-E75]